LLGDDIAGERNGETASGIAFGEMRGEISPTREWISPTRESIDGTRESISPTRESADGTRESIFTTRESIDGTRGTISGTRLSISPTREETSVSVEETFFLGEETALLGGRFHPLQWRWRVHRTRWLSAPKRSNESARCSTACARGSLRSEPDGRASPTRRVIGSNLDLLQNGQAANSSGNSEFRPLNSTRFRMDSVFYRKPMIKY
jgi:hypothetical protein